MNKAVLDKFTDAVKAAGSLSEAAQEALAEELARRIVELSEPQMTDAQRNEVRRRLALPRKHVPESELRAILRRYNPAL